MLLRPTVGQILYDGLDTRYEARKIKSMIGVVPQHFNFDLDLTVGDNMRLHARLYHVEKRVREKRILNILEQMDLAERMEDNARTLSGGQKRKLLIARALLHQPKILFLDEPTVALDPQARHQTWKIIADLERQGRTIILTTHYIEEAEMLCKRVAFLKNGQILVHDSPEALITRCGQYVGLGKGHFPQDFFYVEEKARIWCAAGEGRRYKKTSLEDVFLYFTTSAVKPLPLGMGI